MIQEGDTVKVIWYGQPTLGYVRTVESERVLVRLHGKHNQTSKWFPIEKVEVQR